MCCTAWVDPGFRRRVVEPGVHSLRVSLPLVWGSICLLILCAAQDDGVTPLTLACRLGKATVVKILLEMRADPNQPDVSMHGSPLPTHPSPTPT